MNQQDNVITLTPNDLPAYCPNAAMPLVTSHPRVYLPVTNASPVACPYCGTRYQLVGEVVGH